MDGPSEPADARRRPAAAAAQEGLDCTWTVHLGPLSVGSAGVHVRPQLKFGGQVGNLQGGLGLSDLRDGLRFDAGCNAFAEAMGTGHSIRDVHASIREHFEESAVAVGSSVCNGAAVVGCSKGCLERVLGPRSQAERKLNEALDAAGIILSSSATEIGSRSEEIAKGLGIDTAELERMLAGEVAVGEEAEAEDRPHDAQSAESRPPMTLRLRASTGVSVSCELCLGWSDTTGYKMAGIGAKATAGVAVGGNLFVGRHVSGVGVKIVVGVGNFTLEYTFPCATAQTRAEESALAGCQPAQAQGQSARSTN